jgi:hypothetical protein
VDDRFEFFSTVAIIEDNGPKFLPVEGLIGLQDAGAKGVDDFPPSLFARFNHLAGQSIGVDHRGAESLENFCNGAFSRGDSPC